MNKKMFWMSWLVIGFLFTPVAKAELATGQAAPDFTLTDTEGENHTLSENQGSYVVLEWINHDCPFVKKHYDSGNMQQLQAEYGDQGVVWYSIASSAPGKQGYFSPGEWQSLNETKESNASAVLLDPDGAVGRLYNAQTTPHMYIIDPDGILIYQGAIDSISSTNPEDIENAENYVRSALDQALEGQPVTTGSTKAYGCSVKY